MSRIGRLPISIPDGVTVTVEASQVVVTGPKGSLKLAVPSAIKVEVQDGQVIVSCLSETKQNRAKHGSIRAIINNMIRGTVDPWKKELEIRGTGYKASVNGNKLIVSAGYIHPVEMVAPEGVQFSVNQDTNITVIGCDKVKVGQVASNIRKIRKPEPYKGKGIRYVGEFIKLKAGETAKA